MSPTKDVLSTKNYSMFKQLPGNRALNEENVKSLIRLINKNGNRTDVLPIIIDEGGYVLDGQHRLEALKRLEGVVGFRVVPGNGSIDTVRALNTGGRLWTWRDIAISYSDLGNEEYTWWLEFTREHDLTYTQAIGLAFNVTGGGGGRNGTVAAYKNGGLRVSNKPEAQFRARQWEEVRSLMGNRNGYMIRGWIQIQKSPYYKHERLIKKIEEYDPERIVNQASANDWARLLEDVYNRNYSTPTRLF